MNTGEIEGHNKIGNKTITCSECQSLFYQLSSQMVTLCPECAHHLYGYPCCEHSFNEGRCSKCYWDGAHSDYIMQIKANKV